MNTVNYTIYGAIPEKNFVLQRIDGEVKQDADVLEWQYNIKQLLRKAVKGWTSQTDTEYGEYTPLQAKIDIYTPYKPILIKQLKALLDALTGVIYMDDCTIVDLRAERKFAATEYAELSFKPATKDDIRLPDTKPVILDRYIKPVKATAWANGHPLDHNSYEIDKEFWQYIREAFASQQSELIGKEFDLTAVIGASELGVRTPLDNRISAYNMDSWPITTPDADNCAYSLLTALQKFEYNEPEDLVKLHLIKTYYNPSCSRNRIWLTNHRTTDDIITIGDNFS